mgnify:FL=1
MRSTRHPLLLGFDLSLDQKSEKHFFFLRHLGPCFLPHIEVFVRVLCDGLFLRLYTFACMCSHTNSLSHGSSAVWRSFARAHCRRHPVVALSCPSVNDGTVCMRFYDGPKSLQRVQARELNSSFD